MTKDDIRLIAQVLRDTRPKLYANAAVAIPCWQRIVLTFAEQLPLSTSTSADSRTGFLFNCGYYNEP